MGFEPRVDDDAQAWLEGGQPWRLVSHRHIHEYVSYVLSRRQWGWPVEDILNEERTAVRRRIRKQRREWERG